MKCVINKTQTMAGLHLPIKQHHTMRPLQLPLSLFYFFFYLISLLLTIYIFLTKAFTVMYIDAIYIIKMHSYASSNTYTRLNTIVL